MGSGPAPPRLRPHYFVTLPTLVSFLQTSMRVSWLSALAISRLWLGSAAEETYTITHTNYVTPSCFEMQYRTALEGNPESLTTGIPVVFHYGISADQPEELVSTEYLTHTRCSRKVCYTSMETKHHTTTNTVPANTEATNTDATNTDEAVDNSSAKQRSTHYVYDTVSADNTADKTVTGKGTTTTKTLYKATTTPSVLYKPSTSFETVSQTMKDPLVTAAALSKKLSHTIDASLLSTGTTISALADPVSNSSVGGTTSTIDLRISNTVLVGSSSTPAVTFYGNSSSIASSDVSSVLSLQLSASSASSSLSTTSLVSGSASSSTISSLTSSLSQPSSQPTRAVAVLSNGGYSGDLFEAISTDEPPSVFAREELPLSIPAGVTNEGVPYETNKFFANLFLGDQTDMIWSYPYGMFWKKNEYYGLAVQHTTKSDRVFGSTDTNNPGVDSYYFNPILNGEIIFSATTLSSSSNVMSVSNMESMSALIKLSENGDATVNYVEFPVVQGMGFVTAVYHGDFLAELNTMVGVEELTQETTAVLAPNVQKYKVKLFNGLQWLVYATVPKGKTFTLSTKSSYSVQGSGAIEGLVLQVAVAPANSDSETYYDQAAGQYAITAAVEGEVSLGTSATYSFNYQTKGTSSSGKTMVFSLPHHLDSLSSDTMLCSTGIQLTSTTKGDMTGFLTNELTLSETLLSSTILFLPWTSQMAGTLSYSKEQLQLLASTANSELAVDIKDAVVSVDSTYFSGKVLDKYAYILLVVSDILGDDEVAKDTLEQLKQAFAIFTANKQYYPLMYDTKFGGVTSTAAQGGDSGADFGSAYYNDHHFHYGYYVHAAAVVGHVDKKFGGTWAEDNKEWVNSLVRDVANPSEADDYFPVSRMFDWYAGHSWASGLFASGDGRNEESSSEDYNFAYGMKMWGNVIGDGAMEARGDLMISIMSRAMNKYFYYTNDNTVQPLEIIANKVSGILFDNKVAYTTYFGTPADHPEYVHGIHMLPITPVSSLIRGPTFVQQEWELQISTFIGNVNSGWTGILRLNQALYDSKSSYEFFSSSDWSSTYLDDGQSRTWSLAFSGGVAGS